MATIRFKRGSKAQLDQAAAAGQLLTGEPYFVTELGIAVGTSSTTYDLYVRTTDIGVQIAGVLDAEDTVPDDDKVYLRALS